MNALIFLLHPVLVIAIIEFKINVKLDVNDAIENFSLVSSGNETVFVYEKERDGFGIDDKNLKDIYESLYGKRPWRVLIRGNNWPYLKPVQRMLMPKSRRTTIMMHHHTQTFMRRTFKYNDDAPKPVNVGLYKFVYNKVSSTFSVGGYLVINSQIKFELNVNSTRLGSVLSKTFQMPWGGSNDSEIVKVGAKSTLDLMIDPGQLVSAELQVTKHVLKIEVGYEADLFGNIGVEVGGRVKDFPMEEIFRSGKIRNITAEQVLEIVFYTDAKLLVVDRYAFCALGKKNFEMN